MLGSPIAKIVSQYSANILLKGSNNCIKYCNITKLIALNVGCKVILLNNSNHVKKYINGSIRIVK